MNVHQGLTGLGRFEQGVAASRHLAQPGANGNDQIAFFDALGQLGVDANAHITGVQRMVVVESVLKSERVAHGQLPVFSKPLQGLGCLHRPATTARDHKRLL